MTTFELTDELLTFALRVDDRPMPANLQPAVRSAVAAVGRPRAVGLLWLTDRWGSIARPASSGLRLALLVGLLTLAVLLAAFYIGSRPRKEPNPTLPAVLVTAAPIRFPTPSASAPSDTASPSPSGSPVIEVTPYQEFTAHVEDAKAQFGLVDADVASYVEYSGPPHSPDQLRFIISAYNQWQEATATWLSDELRWLDDHPAETCFEGSRSNWATLRDDLNAFYRDVSGGQPHVLLDRATVWTDLAYRVAGFDENDGASCLTPEPLPTATPGQGTTGFGGFAAHVVASQREFAQVAPLAFWQTHDGYATGSDFRDLWLPAERSWIASHLPDGCYATHYDAWVSDVTNVATVDELATAGQPLPPNLANSMERLISFDTTLGPNECVYASFGTFTAHVVASKTALDAVDQAFADIMTFGPFVEGQSISSSGAAASAARQWLDDAGHWAESEGGWLTVNPGQPCYEVGRDQWDELRLGITALVTDHTLGDLKAVAAGAVKWSDLVGRVREFDPSGSATC